MCLTVKRIRHLNGKPKIAKYDIPCFKILSMCENGELYTPFQGMLVRNLFIKHGLYADFLDVPRAGKICHGIHSFKNIQTAFERICNTEFIVCAYIPKGTKYWIGKGGVYVSKCIKFN